MPYEGFLVWETCAYVLVDKTGSCLSEGYVMSSIVFYVVFGIDMTLGSLSSNGQFCFPTLLKLWCEASGTETCWPFVGACS